MRRLSLDELRDKIKKDNRTFRLLYETTNNNIMCECSICNQQFEKNRKELWSRNTGCPVCKSFKVVKGYNDIATTAPWMIKYFSNKDDAYKYTMKSSNKVLTKCPNCKNI